MKFDYRAIEKLSSYGIYLSSNKIRYQDKVIDVRGIVGVDIIDTSTTEHFSVLNVELTFSTGKKEILFNGTCQACSDIYDVISESIKI